MTAGTESLIDVAGVEQATTQFEFNLQLDLGLQQPQALADAPAADPLYRFRPGEQPELFNDALGQLRVTKWQSMDPLKPFGTPIPVADGVDHDVSLAVLEATMQGDAAEVTRLLGGTADSSDATDAKAEAVEEEEVGDGAAPSKPPPGWRVVDVYGLEPLAHAAKAGRLDVVDALLAAGADVDATCAAKMTALHRAGVAGQAGVVEVLIAHGAFVDAETLDGATPLQMAALDARLTTVRADPTKPYPASAACTPRNGARTHLLPSADA